jgi:hypothetical protein
MTACARNRLVSILIASDVGIRSPRIVRPLRKCANVAVHLGSNLLRDHQMKYMLFLFLVVALITLEFYFLEHWWMSGWSR